MKTRIFTKNTNVDKEDHLTVKLKNEKKAHRAHLKAEKEAAKEAAKAAKQKN